MQEKPTDSNAIGPYYTRIILGEYKRPKPFEKTDFIPKAYIFLPVPTELRDDTYVNWSQENLDTVGDAFNGQGAAGVEGALLRRSGDAATGSIRFVGDVAGAITDTFAPFLSSAVDGATNTVASILNPQQITSAIQAETGFAPNPNPVVMFNGPDLRSYAYSWTLYPHNPEESRRVQKLITTLKSRSLAQNLNSKSASILKYPDMCQVNFFPWDAGGSAPWYWSEGSIIKYKRSVIQAVNVNYAPFGTPGFFAGTNLPTTIQLAITFKEIEYMLANDWDSALEGNATVGTAVGAAVAEVVSTTQTVFQDISAGIASL